MKEQVSYYAALAKYYWQVSPRALKAGAAAGLVALVALPAGYAAFSGEEEVPVTDTSAQKIQIPDLKLQDKEQAVRVLRDLGLTNIDVAEAPGLTDANAPAVVVEQIPAAGALLTKNEKVLLKYGSRELYEASVTKKEMPDLSGMSIAAAKSMLKEMGFTKVASNKAGTWTEAQLFVSAQTPIAKTEVLLSTEVTLKAVPGFNFKQVTEKLVKSYAPYKLFSKVANPQGRDITLHLKAKDPKLTTAAALSNQARVYKLGIEDVLGEEIGRVLLYSPGVKAPGNSNTAVRKQTNDGLTLAKAREMCVQQAAQQYSEVTADWEKGKLLESVEDDRIRLTVSAKGRDSAGTLQGIVISCNITGSDASPFIEEFTVR